MGTYTDLAKLRKSPQGQTPVEIRAVSQESSIEPSTKTESQDAQVSPVFSANASQPLEPTEEKARVQESKSARMPPSQSAVTLASKNARLQELAQSFLQMKNTRNTNFRYPPALLEKIEDIEYEVKKRTGKKLKTTDVLVSAVAYLLWDYEQFGENSVLEEMLVKREW